MNNKITFPRLASLLSDRSGRSKRFSEDFLREFFSLISATLEAKESVKIKGLGTFRLTRVEPRRSVDVTTGEPMEISGHTKVVFLPAKELAEAVNAPFVAFTAIEISDDADISQIFSSEELALQNENEELTKEPTEGVVALEEETIDSEEETNTEKENDSSENLEITENKISETIKVEDTGATEIVDSEIIEKSETLENNFENIENSDNINNNNELGDGSNDEAEAVSDEEYSSDIEETSHVRTLARGLKIVLIAAVVALFATFIIWYIFATNNFNGIFSRSDTTAKLDANSGFVVGGKVADANHSEESSAIVADSTSSDTIQENETENEVPTAPSDIVVYDTIGNTRYLTTMAKAHYGNYNLWPYIYEENKSFLGHPDRIRPGTPVVIPKLSKYGVDPSNNADIEKAKKLGVEIYARYGKKI